MTGSQGPRADAAAVKASAASLPMPSTPSAAAASQPGYAWDARILGDHEPHTKGYGVHPKAIRRRARTVAAAVHPEGSTIKRPAAMLTIGGVLGAVGWILVSLAVLDFANQHFVFSTQNDYMLLAGLPAYLSGVYVFSWAWELGNRDKTMKVALTIWIVGVAIWVFLAVGAIAMVLLAGAGKASKSLAHVHSGGASNTGGSSDGGGGGDSGGGGVLTTASVAGAASAATSSDEGYDWGLIARAFDRAVSGPPDDPDEDERRRDSPLDRFGQGPPRAR